MSALLWKRRGRVFPEQRQSRSYYCIIDELLDIDMFLTMLSGVERRVFMSTFFFLSISYQFIRSLVDAFVITLMDVYRDIYIHFTFRAGNAVVARSFIDIVYVRNFRRSVRKKKP